MECSFDRQFSGSADALVEKARTAATASGGTFEGDAKSGRFIAPTVAGDVKGAYRIDGQKISIGIASKPWIASCEKIGAALDAWLGTSQKSSCTTCAAVRA